MQEPILERIRRGLFFLRCFFFHWRHVPTKAPHVWRCLTCGRLSDF